MVPWLIFGMAAVLGLQGWPACAAQAGDPAGEFFRWRPFLAPFHAVVLHFPIGFVTMAFILEIYQLWRPAAELKRVTVLVLWLSLFTGVISALFGTLRAGTGGYEVRMLELHRYFGMAVPVCTLGTLALQRLASKPEVRPVWIFAYRGFLAGTVALLVVAGHYGGNLTHGSKYLTENAPSFVRELLQDLPEPGRDVPEGESTLPPGLRFYAERIQPVFEAKCYRCHGPEKQKGEYRLDRAETARRGGDSGLVAIKPGAPMESELVRLILLPRDDESVMPPAGKEPLTAEETMAVVQWIQQGAPMPGDDEASSAKSADMPESTIRSAESSAPPSH